MNIKSLFIAAIVMFSTTAVTFGKEESGKAGLAVVPVKGTETFKVIYKGETAGKVKLSVLNNAGVVLFTETINSQKGFIRPINFNGLPFGEYVLEIVDAAGRKVEKVNYIPQVSSIKNVHFSKLKDNDGKYLLSVVNEGSETINVKIYNDSDDLVHEETKQINGNFAQLYSIKNLNSGFTFQVTDTTGKVSKVKQ